MFKYQKLDIIHEHGNSSYDMKPQQHNFYQNDTVDYYDNVDDINSTTKSVSEVENYSTLHATDNHSNMTNCVNLVNNQQQVPQQHKQTNSTLPNSNHMNNINNNNTAVLLDADDSTVEVPLLNNNNKDYNGHLHQHPQHESPSLCHLAQPGFSSNLINKSTQDAKCKMLLAIALCCIFMIVEFLGGYLAGSLAIMTDAAHLATDCISFVIGLVAIWLGGRPPDSSMSFGYKRMEVLGALASVVGIWVLTATLVLVAIERLYTNDFDLNGNTMLFISGLGILINIAMIFVLHSPAALYSTLSSHGHSHAHAHAHSHNMMHETQQCDDEVPTANMQLNGHAALPGANKLKPQHHSSHAHNEQNLNVRAAVIHVIGDLVQSIGVFLASILIRIFPSAKYADPLCTLLFSVIVILTTVRLFKESVLILLDAVPGRICLRSLEEELRHIEGVKAVHHLNVWSHTSDHSIMMVHLVIDFLSDSNTILQHATRVASSSKYNIKHCTIQIERFTS